MCFTGPQNLFPVIHFPIPVLLSEFDSFNFVSCKQQRCSNWSSASISYTVDCIARRAFEDSLRRSLIKICCNFSLLLPFCYLLQVWRLSIWPERTPNQPVKTKKCTLRSSFCLTLRLLNTLSVAAPDILQMWHFRWYSIRDSELLQPSCIQFAFQKLTYTTVSISFPFIYINVCVCTHTNTYI